MLRWQRGRQDGGYDKLLLFQSKRLRCDCWLIRYPIGAYIPPHTDPTVSGFAHHRLNLVIKKSKQGGYFICDDEWRKGRCFKFRPDIQVHSVTRVLGSNRYVLSFGWLRELG